MAQFPTAVPTDADVHIAVNALSTTLDGAHDASITTITVTATSGFPTAGFITIDSEVIQYTGTTATTFTGATRGADGTSAAAHSDAAQVFHNVVAAHHNDLKDEVIAIAQNISDRFGLGSTDVIINSGDVGVGESSPSAPTLGGTVLAIKGTGSGTITLERTSATANKWEIGVNSSGNFSIADSGLEERFHITPAGNFGLKITNPDNDFHVFAGSAGTVVANAVSSMTVENSGDTGIQFLSPNTGTEYILFGDADANNIAWIRYLHSGDSYNFRAGGTSGVLDITATSISIPATNLLYLDGGGDTYIHEQSGNLIQMVTGGAARLNVQIALSSFLVTDLAIDSTKKYFMDGGVDTYIFEESGNLVSIVAGSATGLTVSGSNIRIQDGSASVPGMIFIGDLDTGMFRVGADVGGLAAGGVESIRWDDSVTADDTRLIVYDVTAGTVKRVSRGATDSGGSGFRLLRIAN